MAGALLPLGGAYKRDTGPKPGRKTAWGLRQPKSSSYPFEVPEVGLGDELIQDEVSDGSNLSLGTHIGCASGTIYVDCVGHPRCQKETVANPRGE